MILFILPSVRTVSKLSKKIRTATVASTSSVFTHTRIPLFDLYTPGTKACFPSISTLKLKNGKVVKISELQIGDQVKTVSSTGSVQYSYVKAFLKKQPNTITAYLSITTHYERTLTLSQEHLIYTRKSSADEFNPKLAHQISIGDEVLVEINDNVMPAKVMNVSSLVLQGAYTPLTEEGNILVDEVLSSCYAVVDHDLGQLMMAPMKWFSETMKP